MIGINKDIRNKLMGRSKKEIIEWFGEGENYFPDNLWLYIIKKNWWKKKTTLLLIFGRDGYVKAVNIKEYYFLFSMLQV